MAFPEGSANRIKQLQAYNASDAACAFAKKYKVRVALGTDMLYSAENAARQDVLKDGSLVHVCRGAEDGDSLANINLIGDPTKNFPVIMKDAKICRNRQPCYIDAWQSVAAERTRYQWQTENTF